MAEYWHGKEPFVFMTVTDWPWEKPVTKIQVPPAMLKAADLEQRAGVPTSITEDILEAALRWLSPELKSMFAERLKRMVTPGNAYVVSVSEFNEICDSLFHAEPEVPEAIKDLLVDLSDGLGSASSRLDAKILNERVIEAYKRGQKSK